MAAPQTLHGARRSISAPPPRATFEAPEDGHVLRSEDGGVSEAPAFLSASSAAPTVEDGEQPRRPRNRRPRRRAEDGEAPRAEPETEEV